MFKDIEKNFVQGKYIYYHDLGKINGNKTHRFEVVSREKGIIVGHIKWFPHWNQYVFNPLNCMLESYTMKEIAAFLDMKTLEQKQGWKDFKRKFRTHYDMTNRNAKKDIPV